MIKRLLPFLVWFDDYKLEHFKADLIAGLTVAMVMIPQSMAYAKLAGLPSYYGLYASFLPPIIASLFGSSRHLATGPVAVISLMTASALEPLATAGSMEYIAYAVILAIMVGTFQLLLGFLRMGIIVNFLSHPVVQGFTFAAAIIIATSQLAKIFGVYVDKAESHFVTVWLVLKSAWHYIHWPTFLMSILAFAIMIAIKKFKPRWPNVLFAVVITTILSWVIGYEKLHKTSIESIKSEEVQKNIQSYNLIIDEIQKVSTKALKTPKNLKSLSTHKTCSYCHQLGEGLDRFKLKSLVLKKNEQVLTFFHNKDLLMTHVKQQKLEAKKYRAKLRSYLLEATTDENNNKVFFQKGKVPTEYKTDGNTWRLIVKNNSLDESSLVFSGGGEVVGTVPVGLPKIIMPTFDWSVIIGLLPIMFIISLLGFMEAISIANAIAAKNGQHVNANQELIGQGLGNIFGAFTQSYPVSGSFSRSAVNFKAGGITGMSNVLSGICVAITLLLFTPLLYHLPQAVLVAIIIMAVLGLINIKAFVHEFHVQKYDGIIGVITFIATLVFAPHLDKGIMIGVSISLILYMLRRTTSHITFLSRMADGSYRSVERFHLKQCKHILIVRTQGSLTFTNCDYLKTTIIGKVNLMPQIRHVLIVGNAINEIDASGEETLESLLENLHEQKIGVSFSGLTSDIMDVIKRSDGLYEKIGEKNFYHSTNHAVSHIYTDTHTDEECERCPLFHHHYTEVLETKVSETEV